MDLPDEDQEPLMPPESLIPLAAEAVAAGLAVAVMPCRNPALSPLLYVIGMPGQGWLIQMKDATGTLVWSVLLKGMALDDLTGAGE